MIQPLRKRHSILIRIVAVITPIIFIAGITSRKTVLTTENWQTAPQATSMESVYLKNDLWKTVEIETGIYTDKTPASQIMLMLKPIKYISSPDILVYWQSQKITEPPKTLPDDVFLLGRLAGTKAQYFTLPNSAFNGLGSVILYSLAHQKMVDSANLPDAEITQEMEASE